MTNGSTADADQVMQNYNDVRNGVTDGTKDISVNALTAAGTATLNGSVTLGNSSADDLTITASLASSIAIKTTNTYDIGSALLGLASVYFGTSDTDTIRVVAADVAASRTYTMPDAGASAEFVMNAGAQAIAGVKSFNNNVNLQRSGSVTANTTAWMKAGVASGEVAIAIAGTSTTFRTHIAFEDSSGQVGSISTFSGSTAFNTTSDYRLKQNEKPILGALEKIGKIKPLTYEFKSCPGNRVMGVFAHELAEVIPSAVSGEKDAVRENGGIAPQSVDYSKLVPLLVAAIQELAAKIADLTLQPAN